MTRDAGIEALVRETLGPLAGLSEKTMFGGRAWLVDGHLLCGARHDGMLARLGKGNDAWALDLPGVVPMFSGARRMHGWVRAGPDAYGDDALRRDLIDAAIAFVRTLPQRD